MVTIDGKTIVQIKIYIKRYYSWSRNEETYANYLQTKYALGLKSRLKNMILWQSRNKHRLATAGKNLYCD